MPFSEPSGCLVYVFSSSQSTTKVWQHLTVSCRWMGLPPGYVDTHTLPGLSFNLSHAPYCIPEELQAFVHRCSVQDLANSLSIYVWEQE